MRVLVINLDRSPERLAEFRAEAQRCGLDFERLVAIDATKLEASEVAAVVDPNFRFQPMGRGEIAIFLSHRQAWRIASTGPGRWTAIMEDDVRLADDVVRLLETIEATDPSTGVIRLETTLRRVVIDDDGVPLTPGRSLHRMRSWHGGMAAYVIRKECAAELLARSQRISDPLDQWLFNPLSPVFDTLSIGQVVPGAAAQAVLLDPQSAGAAAVSTSGRRPASDGSWLRTRHGLAIDMRRLAMRLLEWAGRIGIRCRPGRSYRFIPFVRSTGAR